MAKADGEIIAIKFTEELIETGTETDAFDISFLVYDMVPGGQLVPATREVTSMAIDQSDAHILLLTLGKGNVQGIRNAVGNVTIEYDPVKGHLRGRGGAVQRFTRSFTPTGLEPKDNPQVFEHLEFGLSFSDDLIAIVYHDTAENEHLEMSVIPTGTLTYVGDL